jgi:hypothetical protein
MVLSAFASELYLKCLLCIETDKVPEDHNLLRLFDGLKVSTRHELDDLWDTDIRRPEKQAAIEKLRALPDGDEIRLDLRCRLKGALMVLSSCVIFMRQSNCIFCFQISRSAYGC